jgi:hypothetical protein
MNRTIPMQKWTTFSGATTAVKLVQPRSGWVDAGDAAEAVFDIQTIRADARCSLKIMTAISGEGPWKQVLAITTNTMTHDQTYAAAKEGATRQFARLLRWELDVTADTGTTWDMCFKICVTLR